MDIDDAIRSATYCECGDEVVLLHYGDGLYVHANGDACEHCAGDLWLDISGAWRHMGTDSPHCFADEAAPVAAPECTPEAPHPFAATIASLREAIRPLIAVRDALEGAEDGTTTHEAWLALERAFDEIDSALRTLEEDEQSSHGGTCKHCGAAIVDGPYGWGDAECDMLVYCTHQDETHDGVKHEPTDGQ